MTNDYKTCWWGHSGKCIIKTCRHCLFYTSTLQGMFDETISFNEYRRSIINKSLFNLLTSDTHQQILSETHGAPYMDDDARQIFSEELIKVRKSLEFKKRG